MVNQSQAFVNSVQSLSGEGNEKELVEACRRWMAENADKASLAECDRILASLTPPKYSLGHFCALLAKMRKLKSPETDLPTFLGILKSTLPELDSRQLELAPELYHRLFQEITDSLLKSNNATAGVQILSDAVMKLTGDCPTRLTNLHAALLSLCLKARQFEPAMPFLNLDPTKLFDESYQPVTGSGMASSEAATTFSSAEKKSRTGGFLQSLSRVVTQSVPDVHQPTADENTQPGQLKTRSVLLYLYYGSMALTALGRYEEALDFLEHMICLPATRPSAIVIEGVKKYILISLIVGRTDPLSTNHLPSYRAPAFTRCILPLLSTYTNMIVAYRKAEETRKDVAGAMANYFGANRQTFSKDNNVGLVKRVIIACKERAVKRLAKIFMVLKREDLSLHTFLPVEEAELIMMKLEERQELSVRLDEATQSFHFDEPPLRASVDPVHCQADLDAAIERTAALSKKIKCFDDAIRLNPTYVRRQDRGSGWSGRVGGGGGAFPEDEGFQVAGTSSSSPPPLV